MNGRTANGWLRRGVIVGLVLLAAGLYVGSYQLPYWRIKLLAPQYPDGLEVEIFLDHLAGDVREIDGLNHYIGMRPLGEAAVLERRLAPYAIGFVVVCLLAFAALAGRRFSWLLALPALGFPAGFAADSFYWLYTFGNNLDPRAPIDFPPFTPTLLGEGEVGQFTTIGSPSIGFYLVCAAALTTAGAIWASRGIGRRRDRTPDGSTRGRSVELTIPRVPRWGLALLLPLGLLACEVPGASGAGATTASASQEVTVDCDVSVPAGADLGATMDAAESGATICLSAGRYRGTFQVDRPVTIHGPDAAIVENPGHGSTFLITSDDVHLDGFTVEGSGDRYIDQDAGIFVSEANDVKITRLTLRDVLFGVTSQKVNRLLLQHNRIDCRARRALGLRGDGIRLWETRESSVTGNTMSQCRDLVVWYSPDNVIADNILRGGRYGTHFMYSSRNVVRGNQYIGNVVGIFVMYSRNILIDSNVLAEASGAAGVGLGLKESGNLEITRNRFIHNTVGAYIDTSPLHRNDSNLFAHNDFHLGESGITFHSSPHRNAFVANTFEDNSSPIRVEGRGDATQVMWRRNFFDVYAGYDLDDDGVGDVPFEFRSLSNELTGRFPNLEVMTATPALFLIETATRVMPLYQPRLLMRDPEPLMSPRQSSAASPALDGVRAAHGMLELRDEDGRVTVQPKSPESEGRHGY